MAHMTAGFYAIVVKPYKFVQAVYDWQSVKSWPETEDSDWMTITRLSSENYKNEGFEQVHSLCVGYDLP
jgi:major membrane immunogen (membrane-anchored lipoprotein)